MPMPPIDDFWNLGFRLKFLLPSSGIFFKHYNKNRNSIYKIRFLKISLKKDAKSLVETFDNFPEDGIENCGRKPKLQKV
jgi:hypothetical protein